MKEIRTEKEVWKYINRERKKKESVSEETTIQEWEEDFMKLLEGRKKEGKAEREMKKKQTVLEETEVDYRWLNVVKVWWRIEISNWNSYNKKGDNSEESKRDRKEKWVVGQRMWTIEEGSSKDVKRMEEDKD
jgi:hypothetical protein